MIVVCVAGMTVLCVAGACEGLLDAIERGEACIIFIAR